MHIFFKQHIAINSIIIYNNVRNILMYKLIFSTNCIINNTRGKVRLKKIKFNKKCITIFKYILDLLPN